MTDCQANIALPVGLCIDNGKMVNGVLADNLDGLIIVFPSGGMVVSNLKTGDLNISPSIAGKSKLNLRDALQLEIFIDWAKQNSATVFQTHLLFFGNKIQISPNSSPKIQERRFLAVGKDISGDIKHYIVNLEGANTLYQATLKVSKYLQDFENITNLTYLINLDRGCQDVYEFYKSNGTLDTRKGFSGKSLKTQATNLIVYYYE
jgi:hypothetical protein